MPTNDPELTFGIVLAERTRATRFATVAFALTRRTRADITSLNVSRAEAPRMFDQRDRRPRERS